MKRYLCIHGHFYQPPRENPWLEEVEFQETAYPFHDWNQRITSECYAPNMAARILSANGKIGQIVNNYTHMSFNFGPTLLSWMLRKDPDVHQAILESDRLSCNKFSGHGSALAQCYNHIIMPLANSRDKRTQIVWGIKDFEFRFKRKPEGMWLPETAVDLETLDIMAEEGINFTVLAPRQAKAIRKKGEQKWFDVSDSKVDPRRAYFCSLPSGRKMALFFYDGPIAREVAFGDLLSRGESLAQRLMAGFSDDSKDTELVNIATDGETFGHHHPMGDMALAYCLHFIEKNHLARITNYGEFLGENEPDYEVQIFENSSWSCVHGVERWKKHCGCASGMHPGWHQNWRQPLRQALDWLRDEISLVFEKHGADVFEDPWLAREQYINVLLDRSSSSVENFLRKYCPRIKTVKEKTLALQLLEMQRHAMFMYTSCGWFFDEISGIETIQILQYAAQSIQLAEHIDAYFLEERFLKLLEEAPSNLPEYAHGAHVYERCVRPAIVDLKRVAAQFAVSSLFDSQEPSMIYSYETSAQSLDRNESGKAKLCLGRARIRSQKTWEESLVSFAAFHRGDHHLMGGVVEGMDDNLFLSAQKGINEAFQSTDNKKISELIAHNFNGLHFSLEHLFKDKQAEILYQVLETTLIEVESALRVISEHHSPIIHVIKQLKIPLPKILKHTILVMVNTELMRALGSQTIDEKHLKELIEQVKDLSLEIDRKAIAFLVRRKITDLCSALEKRPKDLDLMKEVETILEIVEPLFLNLDLWKAQNIYFSLKKNFCPQMKKRADRGSQNARQWIHSFERLGSYLQVDSSVF